MYIKYVILSYITPMEYINIILFFKWENKWWCLAKCSGIAQGFEAKYI